MNFAETIYGLTDAEGRIFYVGRTYQPRRRLAASRHRHGGAVDMLVLERLDRADTRMGCGRAGSREKYWIERLASEGHNLLNVMHNPKRA